VIWLTSVMLLILHVANNENFEDNNELANRGFLRCNEFEEYLLLGYDAV
jgi:hypothetical protein